MISRCRYLRCYLRNLHCLRSTLVGVVCQLLGTHGHVTLRGIRWKMGGRRPYQPRNTQIRLLVASGLPSASCPTSPANQSSGLLGNTPSGGAGKSTTRSRRAALQRVGPNLHLENLLSAGYAPKTLQTPCPAGTSNP